MLVRLRNLAIVPITALLSKASILLAAVMIVSYLARIVLLLPELTPSQTDRLADIIEQQKLSGKPEVALLDTFGVTSCLSVVNFCSPPMLLISFKAH